MKVAVAVLLSVSLLSAVEGQFANVMTNAMSTLSVKVFQASLENARLFGNISSVDQWVLGSRVGAQQRLNNLARNPNAVIGDSLSPAVEVPMDGFGFKIPESIADMTMKDFIDTHLGEEDPNPPVYDQETLLSIRSQLMDGLTAEQFVNQTLPLVPTSYNFFERYPKCKMTTPFQQGDCGSCWAWATGGALRHRLCKKMVDRGWDVPRDWMLSMQDIISCVSLNVSTSGNGCRSGRSNNAADYIAGRATVDEECLPYLSTDGDMRKALCETASNCTAKFGPHGRNRVSYLHLLEHENRTRELAIMRSIMNNGPVAMTFKVPTIFMGFRGQGVFRMGPNDTFIENRRADGTVSHPVHAVGVVGWGEERGVKFWIAQNSWGPFHPASGKTSWDKGFFKFLRGENHCNFESTAVTAINAAIPAQNPFCDSSKSPCANFGKRAAQPQALAPCEGKFSQGWCVSPDGSGCAGSMLISQPTKKPCAAPLVCCQAAPTVPQTPCESIMDGAVCGDPLGCTVTRSVIRGSLCPRRTDVCCAPTTLSPLLPSSNNDGSLFDMSLVDPLASFSLGSGLFNMIPPAAPVNATGPAPDDKARFTANVMNAIFRVNQNRRRLYMPNQQNTPEALKDLYNEKGARNSVVFKNYVPPATPEPVAPGTTNTNSILYVPPSPGAGTLGDGFSTAQASAAPGTPNPADPFPLTAPNN